MQYYRLREAAFSCNLVTRRPGLVDDLRLGVLLIAALCRADVRTKLGINMCCFGGVQSDQVV